MYTNTRKIVSISAAGSNKVLYLTSFQGGVSPKYEVTEDEVLAMRFAEDAAWFAVRDLKNALPSRVTVKSEDAIDMTPSPDIEEEEMSAPMFYGIMALVALLLCALLWQTLRML